MPLPPGPKHFNFLALRRDPLALFQHYAADYGDVAHFAIGQRHFYLLNQPDLIEEVLVKNQPQYAKGRALERSKRLLGEGLLTSAGDLHLRQRRLIQPIFHRQRIADYGATMVAHAEKLRDTWQAGQSLDLAEAMRQVTLTIVGKTLFDTDVAAEVQMVSEALNVPLALFDLMLLPAFDLLEKLPLPPMQRFKRSRAQLEALIYRMIAEHRAYGERGDLLSMLLAAQDDDGDGARMTDHQVRDEALTLLIAGHETTANALTFAWYLLAHNPTVETCLHQELATVLAGRLPTVADLALLPYTRMVLAETLRLYPPAWTIGRRALSEVEVGGYDLPAEATVLMSQWVMHRDPRYYPDPLKFLPERWESEAIAQRPKLAYFPFGAGPRVCIGEQFAWLEGVLLLATLAQVWQFRLSPRYKLELQPGITLRPKHGLPMRAERRPWS